MSKEGIVYLGRTEREEVTISSKSGVFKCCYEIKRELARELLSSDKRQINKKNMQDKIEELESLDILPYYSGITKEI